jgi:hypothetical protein
MYVVTEVMSVFELPETDLGHKRACGLAVLLGHELPYGYGYRECPACGALIPPQEFENPFDGKPDVCYGDCPNGHSVIDQLEAMIEVDQAT